MNKTKFKAKSVQKLLKANDDEVIAYGITNSLHKVDIFFRRNELVKEIYCIVAKKKEMLTTFASYEFDPDFFFKDMKYFYEDRTNIKLIELFNTFSPGGLKFNV